MISEKGLYFLKLFVTSQDKLDLLDRNESRSTFQEFIRPKYAYVLTDTWPQTID